LVNKTQDRETTTMEPQRPGTFSQHVLIIHVNALFQATDDELSANVTESRLHIHTHCSGQTVGSYRCTAIIDLVLYVCL